MTYSITKDGEPLNPKIYTIDKDKRIFKSNSNGLVLDFGNEYDWSLTTGDECTFDIMSRFKIKSGQGCIFNAASENTFETGTNCSFITLSDCMFDVESGCTLIEREFNKRYFLDDIYRYIVYNDGLLELKNKNDALLNIRHDSEYVREVCNKLIKEKDLK